jgi:hypothetical protein
MEKKLNNTKILKELDPFSRITSAFRGLGGGSGGGSGASGQPPPVTYSTTRKRYPDKGTGAPPGSLDDGIKALSPEDLQKLKDLLGLDATAEGPELGDRIRALSPEKKKELFDLVTKMLKDRAASGGSGGSAPIPENLSESRELNRWKVLSGIR